MATGYFFIILVGRKPKWIEIVKLKSISKIMIIKKLDLR
jgi:hypothetical protein